MANTFEPEAFDCAGGSDNAADRLLRLIGAVIAPDDAPPKVPVHQPAC